MDEIPIEVIAAMDFEVAVIREWKGYWEQGENAPTFSAPKGGYVITFHKSINAPYKIEHYDTVEEIEGKYPQYFWMDPNANDTPDVVLVGI